MMRRLLLPLAALLLATSSFAQTKINFSDVRALDRTDSLHGMDATLQLDKSSETNGALLINTGDVIVKVNVKVSNDASSASGPKDPDVELALDITMKAGKQKETQHVVKAFRKSKKNGDTMTQQFNFRTGNETRTITVTFNVSIE